jgi:raffinose/stachyose/melibiose transport system permease protein
MVHKRENGLKSIAFYSLLPILLFHFIVVVIPSFTTIYNSFTNWSGLISKEFIGFDNYKALFKDPQFYQALKNNLKWMAMFVSIPIIIALSIGYMLSYIKKGRIILRVCFFLPYVISAAISGKIFAAFFNPFLGINSWFESVGLSFLAIDWLSPEHALSSVAGVDMWHWWGFLLVLFMSALQQIDISLYESAEVEGANSIQKLFYITIPSIKSTFLFILLISMVWSVSTFDYVWVMTKGSYGSSLLSTMMYKNAFFKYRAGFACAISVFQTFIAFIIFGVFGQIQKKLED